MIRRFIKRTAQRGLLLAGVPRMLQLRHAGDTVVLAYHNIVPRGTAVVGDRPLHVEQDEFCAHLDALRETYDVVPLAAALEGPADAAPRRPRAVITFDDAYGGAVTCAVPEMVSRAMPATIFVTPSYLDGGAFWWDLLTPEDGDGLDPAFRERALTVQAGQGARILADAAVASRALTELPSHARGACEADLLRAARQPGITLASHTWSHPNLAALPAGELPDELVRPLAWLRERVADVLPCVSYPYGLASPAVERAAEAAGYRAGLLFESGWFGSHTQNRFAIPRVGVPPGMSVAGFRLRMTGVMW